MAMTEVGTVVIPIKAQVEGFQSELDKIRKAISTIDAGAPIGKTLNKALDAVEKRVTALGRNVNQRITSESQLTRLKDELLGINEMFMEISGTLRQVGWDDLAGGLGSQIREAQAELENLRNELTSNVTSAIQEAVAQSADLSAAFKELKIDPNKNAGEILSDLSAGATRLAGEATKAQAALLDLNQQLDAAQARKDSLSGIGIFNEKEFKKQLPDPGMHESIFDVYKIEEFATQFRNWAQSFEQNSKEAAQAAELVRRELTTMTPENVLSKLSLISQKMNEIAGVKKENAAFKSVFGQDPSKIAGQLVTSSKEEIRNPAAGGEAEVQKFRDLINELGYEQGAFNEVLEQLAGADTVEKIKTARNAVIAELRRYAESVKTQVKEAQTEINKITAKRDKQEQVANNANASASTAQTALQQFQTLIDQLKNENATLRQRIENLENQIKSLTAERTKQNSKPGPQSGLSREVAGQAAQNMSEVNRQLEYYNQQLEIAKGKQQALNNLQGFIQRWFSVYAAARMVNQAFNSVKSTLKELDAVMTEIAIVTDMTQSDLWAQMDSYTQMAKQYASSIKGVYEVSQLYYQQGLQTADVMAMTEQTLKMARISSLDYTTATNYMTNAVRSFKMEMSDAQTVVDVYSALAASAATDTAELATAMSKTASSAEAVGSSFENTSAMMTVMIEATREAPENIGSAMKSIISRYGEMTSDPTQLIDSEGEEMSLNKVDKALQTVGISIHDAAGQFRDFDDVIMELASSWDTIDKNTQRYIATIMAGNRLILLAVFLGSLYMPKVKQRELRELP